MWLSIVICGKWLSIVIYSYMWFSMVIWYMWNYDLVCNILSFNLQNHFSSDNARTFASLGLIDQLPLPETAAVPPPRLNPPIY